MVRFIDEANWETFLQEYTARHRGEPTRVGVFEMRDGVTNDYWIDDDLILVGIDLNATGERPTVNIAFENYVHTVSEVSHLVLAPNEDESELGLDIMDASGKTTLIRFEDWLKK